MFGTSEPRIHLQVVSDWITESLRPDIDRNHFAIYKIVTVFPARQSNYQPDALASLWRMVRTIVSPVIVSEGNMFTAFPHLAHTRGVQLPHDSSHITLETTRAIMQRVGDAQTSTSLILLFHHQVIMTQ
jgi:hypothetical protein